MRFQVTRTSYHEGPPCEGAQRGSVPRWDTRTSKTPGEFDALMAERFSGSRPSWLSEGTDHCVNEQGQITRRMGDEDAWLIDLESMEDLAAFVAKHGEVVIQPKFRGPLVLEIYDDYRE